MASGQTGLQSTAWVPTGLKVRGNAAAVDADAKPDTVSMNVLNTLPSAQSEKGDDAFKLPDALVEGKARRSTDAIKQMPDTSPQQQKDQKPGFRPMPVLTVLSLIALGVLLSLGQWQWNKFVLKSNAPAAVTSIESVSVAAALEATDPEYRPVIVDGLLDTRTVKISVVQDGVRGYRLFSPVVMEAGGIFVDQGFVSEENAGSVRLASGQVRLTGVLRKGAKANRYTPDNDVARDVWYWPDLTAMADMLVIQTTSADFYVALGEVDPLATGQLNKNPYADKGGANQTKPETHLGYALQWWGFGLALIGVYIGLHVRAGRLRFRRASVS